MSTIKKIVLTGGPCAGKTTALVKVIEHFSSLGYKVFTIPEVPTMFTQAGMDYLTKNAAFFHEGEKATLEIQLALEDKFMRMAETCTEPVVIVCDRGAMDISAYMTPDMWQEITSAVGVTTQQLRDRMLDKKVIEAWTGHPHLRVINNHEDFDKKINRVLKEISSVLELPQPIVEERKYIVELTGEVEGSIDSKITQTYLTAEPGCEVRLRKREWDGKCVYVHTNKKRISESEQLETERQISSNLYTSLLQQADPYRSTIKKLRKSFIWKGQYFELDNYLEPMTGLMILETKGVADDEDVKFPPFLKVVKDITGNKDYYNYNLAIKKR